jgi:pimeloyl-ACP methyl ester carboxylesterase
MMPIKSLVLPVPGARLHYEVRGAGPTLLLIPGGPADAGVFSELSRHLENRYTVVAYDPRGNSRSSLGGPAASQNEDQNVDLHADDAARLIEALGSGPAIVFGTSGGAQIGLSLAARYPDRVRLLIAHEPPCLTLLPDPSQPLAEGRAIYETYRREGIEAASAQFMALAGVSTDVPDPGSDAPALPPELAETFGRIERNMEYFISHGLLPLSLYRPDIKALRAGQPKVVVGIGEQSSEHFIADVARALAEALGTKPVFFPGDHGGYGEHAGAFAEVLQRTLAAHAS